MTPRQRRFVEEYPVDCNATRAAERAGYSPKSAHAQGHRLLKDAEIRQAIQDRFRDLSMSAEEALFRLRRHAEDPDPSVSLSAIDKILKASGAYRGHLTVEIDQVIGLEIVDPSDEDSE